MEEVRYETEPIYSPVIECVNYIVDFDGNEYKQYINRLSSNGNLPWENFITDEYNYLAFLLGIK